MDTTLSLYRIFYTVAQCGSISAAARHLYISQPAISKSISNLENELQTHLFERTSRGVSLTEEGQLLFPFSGSRGSGTLPHSRYGSWTPYHRRQHNTLQVPSAALSENIYCAISAYQYQYFLPVHQSYTGYAQRRLY
mgnify:CR=1 FL=1